MITFHPDPKVAEQQMHALIFLLAAFGYVDGDFDPSEKVFVRDFIGRLVEQRARDALGPDLTAHRDVVERWTRHFHEVLDAVDYDIVELFGEAVPLDEDPKRFVRAKLELRAFEHFTRFEERDRERLLATVDELMHADGVVHPAEVAFRDELHRLLAAPIQLDEVDVEPLEPGALVIDPARTLAPREPDHPFLRSAERDWALDPAVFSKQAEADLDLIRRFSAMLEEQRSAGRGRLQGAKDFSAFAGAEPFLDGHVYVVPPKPARDHELLVLGDLHGCYSCLKAALLQADFFAKVNAFHADPARNPWVALVLLGDYIDRGRFSYNGILRTVMQLALAVPGHVFALRGNHEYYVEMGGRVLSPVRPAEAITALQGIASNDVFAAYMRLFEAMPNVLAFDRAYVFSG
jgi:hypothetical protein